jgi:signal transduction histidine kinase
MPESLAPRRWYRSLYWRIALGYVALLAVLLLVQGGLAVWLMDRVWGRASRTPADLADLVARDLSDKLTANRGLDIETHVREQYGFGYQPFVVVLAGDRRVFSNRGPTPPNLPRDARRRLEWGANGEPPRFIDGQGQRGDGPRPEGVRPEGPRFDGPPQGRGGGRGGGGPFDGRPGAQYADIVVDGTRVGMVAVPISRPPISVTFREAAPTLAMIGIALLGLGAGVMALLIFGPTHRRIVTLESAARALGQGRTDVRADDSGGDEVSALSSTFNRMASDLEARAAALAESDRARRQLLADVSHELMTPLAAIRGYIETLGMQELKLDDGTRRRYLEIADEETHKLEAIIGDLLDLARLEGGGNTLDSDAVLVDDLLRRVADRHRPALIGRGVTLTTTVKKDTPLIWGDADRLEQALQNVAANAIRHTPDNGTVSLRAEPAGDRVRISVTDSGPGIPTEHLPHIFDRFYKADAARAGTFVPSGSGLGLSIVRAIVHRHGGEVSADNVPGGGAVFTMMLPAAGSQR